MDQLCDGEKHMEVETPSLLKLPPCHVSSQHDGLARNSSCKQLKSLRVTWISTIPFTTCFIKGAGMLADCHI